MGDGPNDHGSSRSRLIRSVHNALRRLRTDHIDLYQLHAYDASTPIPEVLDAVSATGAAYPYFPYERQEGFALLNPPAVASGA